MQQVHLELKKSLFKESTENLGQWESKRRSLEMVTPYNSEQKYLYDLKKRVFTGKGLSIDRSSVQEKLKFALCSRLRSAIPYPSEAFAKQESQHQFIFLCPGYCVQQFLCILQPVLPSCGMLGVHSLKKKEKKKKKVFSTISFSPFHLLLAQHCLSGDRV